MNIWIMGLVRVIITCVCLYFVYQETGGVTTFLFAMLAITNEIMAHWMRHTQRVLNDMRGIAATNTVVSKAGKRQ